MQTTPGKLTAAGNVTPSVPGHVKPPDHVTQSVAGHVTGQNVTQSFPSQVVPPGHRSTQFLPGQGPVIVQLQDNKNSHNHNTTTYRKTPLAKPSGPPLLQPTSTSMHIPQRTMQNPSVSIPNHPTSAVQPNRISQAGHKPIQP